MFLRFAATFESLEKSLAGIAPKLNTPLNKWVENSILLHELLKGE